MKKAILSLAILMGFSLFFTVCCGSNVQAPSGALPTWKVGDTWTTMSSGYGSEYTFVKTVTGEQVYNGIDCYTVTTQVIMNPTIWVTDPIITEAFDKTTLQNIGKDYSINGTAHAVTTNTSYNYSVKPYPLSIGKTWTVTENVTTSSTGESNTTTKTHNYTYKVEKVESITVPAGTFQCFKIVMYDDNNSVLYTEWVTDITRGASVKKIVYAPDHTSGITSELMSYSLSK